MLVLPHWCALLRRLVRVAVGVCMGCFPFVVAPVRGLLVKTHWASAWERGWKKALYAWCGTISVVMGCFPFVVAPVRGLLVKTHWASAWERGWKKALYV